MIGEEVNQTAQAAAGGTVRRTSSAKDAHNPPGVGDFESVIHEQVDPEMNAPGEAATS
jgi:hypothetical protein